MIIYIVLSLLSDKYGYIEILLQCVSSVNQDNQSSADRKITFELIFNPRMNMSFP